MTNNSAIDSHIADLIEKLANKAGHPFTDAADRQQYIDQIAQLRASQNPVVHNHIH